MVANTLVVNLELEGFAVSWAANIAQAHDCIQETNFQMIVLDLGLPDGNGLEFCQYIQNQRKQIPVIILTAQTDEDIVVAGLEAGASDYIKKPFSNRELIARIRAVLRDYTDLEGTCTWEDLLIKNNERSVSHKRVDISFNRREFDIFVQFVSRPNVVMTRDRLLAQLIGDMPGQKRVAAVRSGKNQRDTDDALPLFLLNHSGAVIADNQAGDPELDFAFLQNDQQEGFGSVSIPQKLFRPSQGRLFRLPGEPLQYLYFKRSQAYKIRRSKMLVSNFLIVGLAVVIGIFVSALLIFGSFRKKATEAGAVIQALKQGNLKARFPIRKMDEIGQAMLKFNEMAGEIERLVESLRLAECTRGNLLLELAHDLRTPLASLRSMFETLAEKQAQLSVQQAQSFFQLSLSEVDYFSRLVDDLLFLGRVEDPYYTDKTDDISISNLLREVIVHLSMQYPDIQIVAQIPAAAIICRGNAHVFQRLFRNLLENAFAFAGTQITINLGQSGGEKIILWVQDDGKGFDASSLAGFGQRKFARKFITNQNQRLSIRLGSVIMQSIVHAYRGEIQVANIQAANGAIRGAKVLLQWSSV